MKVDEIKAAGKQTGSKGKDTKQRKAVSRMSGNLPKISCSFTVDENKKKELDLLARYWGLSSSEIVCKLIDGLISQHQEEIELQKAIDRKRDRSRDDLLDSIEVTFEAPIRNDDSDDVHPA